MKAQPINYLMIVALLGVLVSFYFSNHLYTIETNRITTDFHNEVDRKSLSLEREFSLSFESLQSLKVLFDYDRDVDETMFHKVANEIYSRHKNIQALEWIPKVLHDKRNDYIGERRKSHPGFTITERGKTGAIVKRSDSEVYFPVYYVEPMAGNETAFGFDLASSEKRLKALEKSRDNGVMVLTESIRLVQEKESQKAVLSFLPIYKHSPTTLAQRRENLSGFVLGVFRVGDIFNSAMFGSVTADVEYALIDKTNDIDDVLHLYRHPSDDDNVLLTQMLYEIRIDNMLSRQWYLSATPTEHYMKRARGFLPYFVFISGALFSVFGAFLFYIITYRTLVVEREKYKVYQSMVSASQHVLNNFLHQMQLFRKEAERSDDFDRRLLTIYDEAIGEATAQVKELSNIKQLDDKSIKASVYPK